MKQFAKLSFVVLSILLVSSQIIAQTTFTSVSAGNWNDGATWGNTSPGVAGIDYPGEGDDAVIGHTVTIDNTLDNDTDATQEQPDNFAGVCGADHEACGTNSFYLNGKVTINSGGTFYATVPIIIADTLEINNGGSYHLDDGADDTWVLGFLDVKDFGSFLTEDHLNVSGTGIATVSENGTAQIGDDLFFDGDNSFLCGRGTWNLIAGSNNSIRSVNNDGETLDQICAETTIDCADGNCCGSDCTTDIMDNAGTADGNIGPNEPAVNNRPSTSSTLPVEMTYFDLKQSDVISIQWGTASELNNEKFEVQKSTDGESFYHLGSVYGHGTTTLPKDYEFVDYRPSIGVNYYRLKQIDFDGAFEYSRTRVTFYEAVRATNIYPNPATDELKLSIGTDYLNTTTEIKIINMAGKQVFYSNEILKNPTLEIEFNLESGLYFLTLKNGSFKEQLKFQVK